MILWRDVDAIGERESLIQTTSSIDKISSECKKGVISTVYQCLM